MSFKNEAELAGHIAGHQNWRQYLKKLHNIVVYFAKFLYAIYAVAQRWMKKLLAGHLVALLVIV